MMAKLCAIPLACLHHGQSYLRKIDNTFSAANAQSSFPWPVTQLQNALCIVWPPMRCLGTLGIRSTHRHIR
ncbi:hypothetical protein BDW02DRAFT_572414 [Decorospora gaudefroyi]|uniref:Uncharacterized protein n=1 Tax=Decorospora gaudefroyi TaxID=184978 RepID=A0A6A5K428_9PLEO|nr:hypothetical protein BDW02DRAFT_572414 [Decorospora gaudefroyi]